MKPAALCGLLLVISACAANSGATPSSGGCEASGAQTLIGQSASIGAAADARRRSGARTVRWLQPGQIVTMEFRPDRVSLVLDAQNRIEAVRCG